jgi:hypothetical protein
VSVASQFHLLHITDVELLMKVRSSIWYGYAAIHAYLVYRDPFFLQIADLVWGTGNSLTISEDEVEAASANNVTLAAQCSGGEFASQFALSFP